MNNTYLNNLEYEPIRKVTNRKIIKWIAITLIFLVIVLTVIFTTKKATAKRDGYRVKQATSVEIQKGDTLWSIASIYISDEYDNINEYIAEIMFSNGLSSDTIHAGNYIIVPYYSDK